MIQPYNCKEKLHAHSSQGLIKVLKVFLSVCLDEVIGKCRLLSNGFKYL